jgi:oxygen-independent coproporphyrinogen-3 oxidase
MIAPLLNPGRKIVQLHFGGGSPTFSQPEEILQLGSWIHKLFYFEKSFEASVEVDPRTATQAKIKAFAEIGVNRVSIGIQDLNPDVQKAVHRYQPHELNLRTLEWIHSVGIESFNVDLIYGLPLQTASSFEKTLDEILKIKPSRFAVFNYAHVPWLKKAQSALTPLPPEVKMDILKMTVEKLTDCGYTYIGMDHFALETDELSLAQRNKTLQRNFQGYSTHSGSDLYAFGMSSISQTDSVYWQNEKDLKEYYTLLDEKKPVQRKGYLLSDDDKIRQKTIMRLMCDLELNYQAMSNLLAIDFTRYFSEELACLEKMQSDGLLVCNEEGIKVTDLGRLFIRNIVMHFDVYLKKDSQRRFSQTV